MADEAIADIDQVPFTQAREQHLEADVRARFRSRCVAVMRKERHHLTPVSLGIRRQWFCPR